MKKILLVGVLLMNLIAVNAIAQCKETHLLCQKQFTKEDKKQGWNVNQQSISLSFEKGQVYEMVINAYLGMEYRLSACTDVAGGTPAQFKLEQDVRETVKDADGNTSIERRREVIFDNSLDETEDLYVLFRSSKTEKFYLSVTIPLAGKSKSKKLSDTDLVCIGVLLEHRKTKKSAF